MPDPVSIKDIMTKAVIAVKQDRALFEAAKIIAEHGFDGVPVIDDNGKLVGILTEYDLVSKGSAIHLPTLQMVLQNLSTFKKDKQKFKEEIAEISALKVKDVMNADPLTLPDTASFQDAVIAFRDHHRVNPIPVINSQRQVVGIISRFDVIRPLSLLG